MRFGARAKGRRAERRFIEGFRGRRLRDNRHGFVFTRTVPPRGLTMHVSDPFALGK
jgi:hypothetical protein